MSERKVGEIAISDENGCEVGYAGIVVVGEGFQKPSDRPVFGEKRLVPYLPFGLPGQAPALYPCLWTSPYEFFDEDLHEKVKICLLLVQKGDAYFPQPNIVGVRIPSSAIARFELGPVEW